MAQTNATYVCSVERATRNLQTRRHKDEKEVKAKMVLVGEEQQLAIEKLHLRGDFHHNWDVLSLGDGEFIMVRNPRAGEDYSDPKDFLPYPDCLGFFKADELCATLDNAPTKRRTIRAGLKSKTRQSFCCRGHVLQPKA